jgi:hypothetical protein
MKFTSRFVILAYMAGLSACGMQLIALPTMPPLIVLAVGTVFGLCCATAFTDGINS